MMGILVAAWVSVVACAGPHGAAEPVPVVTEPDVSAAPGDASPVRTVTAEVTPTAPPIEEAASSGPTPQALYAQCSGRVEGVSAAGECASDADCTRAGCSGEVCVATANKATAVTTCEILPCFDVLQSCGCVDGMCSWTVGASSRPTFRLPLK
jgi:eight-cysteine-cluster-containing protein